jgi:uncharacterized protein YkwD
MQILEKAKKLKFDVFFLGFIMGLTIGTFIVSLVNTNMGGTSAMRSKADINLEQYHYIDNEAMVLADSISDTGLRAEALEAFNEVNEIRAEAGLDSLYWDKNLETVASVRAKECSEKFSHTRPNGSQWYTVNSKIQGGENLAYGYDNANDCVNAWMNSPTHRDNILYDEFEKVAISIYEENGIYYWSQQYGYN